MIAVIGAGLTGLSAAYHLGGPSLILEREARAGGLCRSETVDGFTFDLTGHLLHLKRPEIVRLVSGLIPEAAFNRIDRRSFIYSHGVFTPYPYQVNTHGLPPEVIAECVTGFVEAVRAGEIPPAEAGSLSFRDWVLATFGRGVARHFMFPYNEKLWRTDLSEMTCEWVSWAVPRPSVEEVIRGALGLSGRAFGYNPSFLYPKRGGIQILPDALASKVEGLRLGAEVLSVNARRRTLSFRTAEGRVEEVAYEALVSTMPLPSLLRLAEGLPPALSGLASGLRFTTVVNINLGVERAGITDMHWVYFPGPEFVFYRCGFPTSFTPHAAPEGCSSIYVEISLRPDEAWSEEDLAEKCRDGLVRCGLLRPEDRIVSRKIFHISPAYVIYDRTRRRGLGPALAELRKMGIHSVGRYGAWYYNSMEDSLEEGRRTALEIGASL
ncbi:MAG TPA: FAD-dependent oxidoreductase [Candidatus Saccharimonadales bacterium]|nr:FAD-dependent oxidoreductase [Candidatus Saccharimonadales bacterium]